MSDGINTRLAFVLASCGGGTMIVGRMDGGVSHELLEKGWYYVHEAEVMTGILKKMLPERGPGMIVLDIGANLGAHTVSMALMMRGWGRVVAFEPQEFMFYALCGNIAINNLFNARAYRAAVGNANGIAVTIPQLDMQEWGHPGSVRVGREQPGDAGKVLGMEPVDQLAIDSMGLTRCDAMKIDVEGAELAVLEGAYQTIQRCKPVLYVEHFQVGAEKIRELLPGYRFWELKQNMLCVHESESVASKIVINQVQAAA